METKTLLNYLQTANINFLIGSGASMPFLGTLGKIEEWLTELSKEGNDLTDVQKKALKASFYRSYFEVAIHRNQTKQPANKFEATIKSYAQFLSTMNEILNRRGTKLVSKQVNLFTTNVDTLIENAAEVVGVEFNDGFRGSVNQSFNETNFRKTVGKASLHFQSVSELPVFNLYKIHGSINWKRIGEERIGNDFRLDLVKEIADDLNRIPGDQFVKPTYVDSGTTKLRSYSQMKDAVRGLSIQDDNQYNPFLAQYEKLIMVNPTKHKFQETVMDMHFYELMRLYSNSLEKENSILFVIGFSFADEHIAKLTMRAADSNPTLQVVVFAHKEEDIAAYKKRLGIEAGAMNSNVRIFSTKDFKNDNRLDDKFPDLTDFFTLSSVETLFSYAKSKIPVLNG